MARIKKAYKVITFHTTTEAMAFEKNCLQHNIPGRMIPVPREISAGCGLSWRMNDEDFHQFKEMIEEQAMPYEAINGLIL